MKPPLTIRLSIKATLSNGPAWPGRRRISGLTDSAMNATSHGIAYTKVAPALLAKSANRWSGGSTTVVAGGGTYRDRRSTVYAPRVMGVGKSDTTAQDG